MPARPYIIETAMIPVACAAPLLALLAQATGPDAGKVFEKVADSVVAIRALAPVLGERSGTGVVLTRDGLILASYATCPEGSTKIRVWVRGPRRYDGELVATSRKDEIALLRIKPAGDLKPIETGDSSRVRVGDVSYTIGNAANSIIIDDQPSFNAGIVSGLYVLPEERANSTWRGPVIETTAAVNVGMEGAPLLDREGKMVGSVTLNYSPSRFLGAAIPIDEIKPVTERLLRAPAAGPGETPPEAGEGHAGFEAADRDGRVVVGEVEPGGPAARAGLGKGDVLLEVAGAPVKSARDVAERLRGMQAGAIVWLKVEVDGAAAPVRIVLGGRKK